MTIANLRRRYHRDLAAGVLGVRTRGGRRLQRKVRDRSWPVYSNADKDSDVSVELAARTADKMRRRFGGTSGRGSTSGAAFERATLDFVASALDRLAHLRVQRLETLPGEVISNFEQYAHLDEVEALIDQYEELEIALGGDYLVKPDIVVVHDPFTEEELAARGEVVGDGAGLLSPQRASNSARPRPTLHASISCKWTMRSDRAQNTRTEGLNLVRNRKARLPHIAAVTMEPTPGRLASIAHGTGDIDCVYHGALYELLDAAAEAGQAHGGAWTATSDALSAMVEGRRLRDISDLPLDLLV